MGKRMLPVGVDDFGKLRENDYYYVDKTGMIAELLNNLGEVNLFVRPRRFGKTLNMSMLKYFFEIGTDTSLFDGLAITREETLCRQYMGKYPVISLSLKLARGLDFETAKRMMSEIISMETRRFTCLLYSDKLEEEDKETFRQMRIKQENLENSILKLSEILYRHFGEKVIILIDEYDVPLQKAEENGYYREMVELISQMFSAGMKTNPYMKFAVVTGCLRVSKESIFTGFNNPKVHTIVDERYDEWFGFTDDEVKDILTYYEQEDKYKVTKEWYDGYLFGKEHVYCPWDVINWCDVLVNTTNPSPQNFWANSSGNQMIKRFASQASGETKNQLEQVLAGECVWKKVNMELTYDEIDSDEENLWSVLFMTGYLTYKDRNESGEYELKIPNKETHILFRGIVDQLFRSKVRQDQEKINIFYENLDAADAEKIEQCIQDYLFDAISYLDGGKEKENFYHGMMLGMLQLRAGWITKSNREAGEGRFDIAAYSERGDKAIVFEFKYVKNYGELREGAETALHQIDAKAYDKYFETDFLKEVIHIGIAFCKKRCRVAAEKKFIKR